MQYRRIGLTDIEASSIALGTWVFGGWLWGGSEEKEAIGALHAALDEGITLIDTAPIYGFGRSEEIVGKAIKGIRRDSYVLASKCGLSWDTKEWVSGKGEFHVYSNDIGRTDTLEKWAVYRYLHPDAIRQGVEDSLRRLGVDYIDIMQVHHVGDKTTPIADTMGALQELKQAGKIRAIGISNASLDQLIKYADQGELDIDQERYSLLDRSVEKNGIMEECKKRKISFFAYSPMENGLLTGKIDPNREYNPGDLRKNNPRFTPNNVKKINSCLNEFRNIAEKYDLTAGQLVIAWTAAQYEKMHVLCGCRNVEQVRINARAGSVELEEGDVQEINERILDLGLIYN